MNFELEKPRESEEIKEEMSKILNHHRLGEIFEFIKKNDSWGSGYMYFDKMKYKQPAPEGVSKEALWQIIKLFRNSKSLKTPIKDEKGNYFKWVKLDYFEKLCHELDMNTGGELSLRKGGYEVDRQKLIVRGVMEEAIASSQLEGAATSREEAKQMLREQRKPINQSEQMILNSYMTMKAIEEDYKNREMDMDMIMEIHSLITKDTRDFQGETPRFRDDNEPVYVSDNINDLVYHRAPKISFVKKELEELIKFINDDEEGEKFIHPLVKAIMIHFWVGYLHPFTDGNGRLSRSLFYWYLLKKGYWGFAYLPVSRNIMRSVKKYIMSFVYSEQDDNDLTYFIDYNMRKVKLAMDEFDEYLERKSKDNSRMKSILRNVHGLNDRQVQLLQYLYGDPEGRTNVKTHMHINAISKATAIADLKDLLGKGFLRANKQGRNVYYSSTGKVGKD